MTPLPSLRHHHHHHHFLLLLLLLILSSFFFFNLCRACLNAQALHVCFFADSERSKPSVFRRQSCAQKIDSRETDLGLASEDCVADSVAAEATTGDATSVPVSS